MKKRRGSLALRLLVLGILQVAIIAIVGDWLIRSQGPGLRPFPPPGQVIEGHCLPPLSQPPPWRGQSRRVPPPLVNFLTGIVVVGLWAFGVARWVVKPLNELSRAANALGRGDLTARTGLTRTDELGEVGKRFDEMAERIQALVVAEKEMLANVSHELRTPLARIRVALDIAAEGDATTARTSLQEISLDLAELESLIDDILTTMRLEGDARAATLPLRRVSTSVASIVDTAAERFRARHPRRELEVDVGGDLPAVLADPTLFRRVIDNLLENAHKYSPDEGSTVKLAAGGNDERVTFEVADQGIGIPAEDLPHLFTAFFRGERSRSRGTGGVGLGLTLAKRIVEAHGGSIAVTSSAKGTTFRVDLPAAKR